MRQLIAVTGQSNRGKSRSVVWAYHCLRCRYPDAKVEHVPGTINARYVDVGCIVTIGSIKIGIESQGDPGSRLLAKSLPLFAERGCQLIVCAARNGEMFAGVEKFSIENGYEVVRICKTQLPQEEREEAEHATAQEILQAVERHLK